MRVFHLDCFWMKQYEWCSFTFDPDNFPDPRAYLAEIKRKYGVKICVWSKRCLFVVGVCLVDALGQSIRTSRSSRRSSRKLWRVDISLRGLMVPLGSEHDDV